MMIHNIQVIKGQVKTITLLIVSNNSKKIFNRDSNQIFNRRHMSATNRHLTKFLILSTPPMRIRTCHTIRLTRPIHITTIVTSNSRQVHTLVIIELLTTRLRAVRVNSVITRVVTRRDFRIEERCGYRAFTTFDTLHELPIHSSADVIFTSIPAAV